MKWLGITQRQMEMQRLDYKEVSVKSDDVQIAEWEDVVALKHSQQQ